MPPNSDISERLLKGGEHATLEFLKAADLDAVGRAVVAFLNSGGGTVVIGVQDDGTIAGVSDPDAAVESIRDHLAATVAPLADWSVSSERIGDTSIVLLDIPDGVAKPYAHRSRILVRRGSNDVAADQSALLRLIATRSLESERWERRPALGVTLADLDDAEILRTAALAHDRRPGVAIERDPKLALEAFNLMDAGQVLNGAVIVFAKKPERRYPQTRVRVARFTSDDLSEFADNRVFEGNLLALLTQIDAFFAAHLPVASSLATSGFERADRPSYPPYALREAVINALVHRDYSTFDGGVSIALYPERLEIWNSGQLPAGLSAQDLKESRVSRPHNPDVAHVLFLRGLIERWGIGTRRIAAECSRAGLPEPEWEEVGGGVRLVLRLSSQLQRKAVTRLNARQYDFAKRTAAGTQIDVQDYQREFAVGVTERTARRDLVDLLQLGYLILVLRGLRQIYMRTAKQPPDEQKQS